MTLPAQTFKTTLANTKENNITVLYLYSRGKKWDSAHVGDCLASSRRASAHTFHNKNYNSGLITGREEKSAPDCRIKSPGRGINVWRAPRDKGGRHYQVPHVLSDQCSDPSGPVHR